MVLKGIKRILMLFLIPLWIPIFIIHFIYIWLWTLPRDFVSYHLSGMKRFGRFSGYRNPVMRLNFVIFSKIRNFNHEYVNEIAGSMIVDCFWVITGNKNYAFISEQCLTTPKDHHEIINSYKKYFQMEYGVALDKVLIVTESRQDLPVGNDSTIETGSIRTMLRTRGKL